MNAKFICVGAEASVAGAVAIPLPPGAWCGPRGVGPGLLGLGPSWGYSQTLPWLEVAPAQPSWIPSPESSTDFEFSDGGPEGPAQSHSVAGQ